MLAYRTLLSETMLSEGLSNIGDSRRMERFVQKLLNGELNYLASLTAVRLLYRRLIIWRVQHA